ncbi:MAG TPA: hypothetical protein VNZ49_15800 [Bacteroidia bacterium]|jgi:hypothetical protein|nr:hypothetical protein [Bacteroidia bacterium]
MSNKEIKTINSISEFQEAINQVKTTKQSIKISHYYVIAEKDWNSLDMEGIDIIVGKEYDEIISLE